MQSAHHGERRKRAQELAQLWSRVSRQHLSAGQGCSCGFGGLVLQAADFELDIVEFLIGDARKAGASGVEHMIEKTARRGPDRYSLSALIAAIENSDPAPASEKDIEFALSRLSTTLTSIEAAHSRGRFACD